MPPQEHWEVPVLVVVVEVQQVQTTPLSLQALGASQACILSLWVGTAGLLSQVAVVVVEAVAPVQLACPPSFLT